MFSDWSFEDPYRIMDRLKKQPTCSNFQRRTVGDFFAEKLVLSLAGLLLPGFWVALQFFLGSRPSPLPVFTQAEE